MNEKGIQSETLQKQAYEYLREKIVNGWFPPGQRLLEEKIAKETGMSRIPVREAIRRLIGDGLVSVNRRGGVSVRRLTFDDFSYLYECRVSLEPTAARLAAVRMSELQRAEMNKLVYDMNQAVEKRDIEKLRELSARFHNLILEGSKNPHLIKLMKQLYDLIAIYRNAVLNIPHRLESGAEEHQAIWEAIRKQDGEAAEKLMREHIQTDFRYYVAEHQKDGEA